MHLALDTRWIFEAISGIGVHTRELVRHLPPHIPGDGQVTLLFETEALRDRLASETKHPFDTAILPYGPNAAANQYRLGRDLRTIGVDLYHGTNYMLPLAGRMPRSILTVHDLIPIMVPNYAPRSKKSKIPCLFPMVLKRCVARADAVIAVSQNTKRDLVAKLGVPETKISVIHNGILETFVPADPDPQTDLSPFILSVGRRDPYKNLVLLIEAFAELADAFPELQLRIIGPEDPRYPEAPERVRQLDLEGRVHFLGPVDDATLLDNYQQASLLAFPSSYEGFGLPVLEAMACGTPVICARSSSLPEVAGDAAVYVPVNEKGALHDAMRNMIASPNLRKTLIEKGLHQSKKFSWEQAAIDLARLYRQISTETL